MSMSTSVIGFRPPDQKWMKMKAAWDACVDAGIPIPKDIDTFFGYEEPDKEGVRVDLGDALKEWSQDSTMYRDVDISKLPKDVTIIRFSNSW
jgi:hypothetical protein